MHDADKREYIAMGATIGFHRLGVVFAAPFLAASLIAAAISGYHAVALTEQGFNSSVNSAEKKDTEELRKNRFYKYIPNDDPRTLQLQKYDSAKSTMKLAGFASAVAFFLAILVYLVCRAIGWVASGFRTRDNQQR